MNRRGFAAKVLTGASGAFGVLRTKAAIAEERLETAATAKRIDEWRRTAAWTYSHAGEVADARLFHNMIQSLRKDLRCGHWRGRYGFYLHPSLIEHFQFEIESHPNYAGNEFLLRDDIVYYRGVRLVGVPSIATELPPIHRGLMPFGRYTEIFLGDAMCDDPNVVLWGQDIRFPE